jgi:hypothetical protein
MTPAMHVFDGVNDTGVNDTGNVCITGVVDTGKAP